MGGGGGGEECGSCVGSVQHYYSSCREAFRAKFKELIGDSFEQLSDIDKTVYVLGCELWEQNFEDTLIP